MTRTSLNDALRTSLMPTMPQLPRAREIPQGLSPGSATRRRCVALWKLRCGCAGRARRGATSPKREAFAAEPDEPGRRPSVCHRFRRWSVRGWRELVFEALRPALPADGLALLDSTACKAHRAASGAARSSAEAECLGRSRGGLCSKLHACAEGAGRVLRLIASPGQHPDLRCAPALMSSRKSPCDFAGVPARHAALDRGHASARLRAAFAADGCTVHTPPKLGMVDPPPWDRAIHVQRHHAENLFSKLKDGSRIAFRRDKTRRSWMGFAHLAATLINLRSSQFSHGP